MEKLPLQDQVLKMGQNFKNMDSAPGLHRHKNSLADNFLSP